MKKLFSNMKQRYSLRDYKFSLVVLVLAISVIGIFKCKTGVYDAADPWSGSWSGGHGRHFPD